MKFIVLTTLSSLIAISCQSSFKKISISVSDAHKIESQNIDHQIYCSWIDDTSTSKSFHLEATLSNISSSSVDLVIHQDQNNLPKYLKANKLDDKLSFEIPDAGWFQISLKGTPIISTETPNHTSKACVRLISSSAASSTKPATCNAQGTPAAGWYQSGKILTLRENCQTETLTCGIGTNPGWFVQKKKNITSLKKEKCSWMRPMPVCKTNSNTAGWYLNDQLIAEDATCHNKNIECSEHGTANEGWYSYHRSTPELLVQSNCISNREISYLER